MTRPRLLVVVALVVALAASACGNSPPQGPAAGPAFTDGTRLVARSYSFPGTEPLFIGVFDRQEMTPCSFRTARDGKLRCLPVYLDPALDDAPEQWVEGTEQPGDESTPRLRSHHVVSADGGRFPNRVSGELYDAQSSWGCSPVPRGKDQAQGVRCLPRYVSAPDFFFADASCSESLAMALGAQSPMVAVLPNGALHAVGPAFTTSPFVKNGTECTSTAAVEGLLRVGAPLPEDVVTGVEIAARGTGRLALRTLEKDGLALGTTSFVVGDVPTHVPTGPYVDHTLGIDCQPFGVLNGNEIRCLPSDAEYLPLGSIQNFADPGCTQPVVNTTRLTAVLTFRGFASEIRRLGDYSQTAYTSSVDGCRENARGTGRVVLDEVPATTFAKLDVQPPL
jgi:hypothetical protein